MIKINYHRLFCALALLLILGSCKKDTITLSTSPKAQDPEVIYHIFIRSFYDSNGDYNGDFQGIKQKLDYLEELGITSIMLIPIVKSVYYHNYFADDFEETDPAYGSMEDWIDLVEAIHKKGMKIYLDQEFQYATIQQEWFKDSYKNPASEFSDYILYKDSLNQDPEPIVYDIDTLRGYNDSIRKVAMVNLKSPKVQEYFYNLLKFWIDPNGDLSFTGGVDGFRLDHMMDDLDHKGILPNLFEDFWCPLITQIKKVNPDVIFIAEQAEWTDYGKIYLEQGCIDRVFAFNVWGSILSFEKPIINAIADTTFTQYSKQDQQLAFIENHDIDRFASVVDNHPEKLRTGAALNFFIGGIPTIYYGQELGMLGAGGDFGDYDDSDSKDISRRLAFPWKKDHSSSGYADWYHHSGSKWDTVAYTKKQAPPLAEQKKDSTSLWHYYKNLIAFYKAQPALIQGEYREVVNKDKELLTFLRYTERDTLLVGVNLSGTDKVLKIPENENPFSALPKNIWSSHSFNVTKDSLSVELPGYGIEVWK